MGIILIEETDAQSSTRPAFSLSEREDVFKERVIWAVVNS